MPSMRTSAASVAFSQCEQVGGTRAQLVLYLCP